ncbi:hypothetical protein OS493_000566 [Desmophyllum pertusum]|uniref:Uncharacterized protein n=1 Tax=Desmophyllum pertusum TaxID=174260 RepID=A0A9X0DBS4_9CNID|nr:hypothetical protein OS493_000566 [Desmophyllum pertusum]
MQHAVTTTIWMIAKVSRRRPSKKESHLLKKLEYASVVSALGMYPKGAKTEMCARCMPHPTVLHDDTKSAPKNNEDQVSKQSARVSQSEEATCSCTSTCNATRASNASDAITNQQPITRSLHLPY